MFLYQIVGNRKKLILTVLVGIILLGVYGTEVLNAAASPAAWASAGTRSNRNGQEPWAAFIRQGELWVKINGQESRLIREKSVARPRWSADGTMLAYTLREKECWIYQLKSKRALKLSDQSQSYQWSPARNELAIQEGKLLSVYDGSMIEDSVQLKPVISGVGNYSWKPDGRGFLISTQAELLPSGWTQVQLYDVPADAELQPSKVKLLFTLPAQDEEFFAIGTSPFKWSSNQQWISFVATPTASLSADGNTLCMLSRDGKRFYTLDSMLNAFNWFKWAPSTERLANIAGSGRMATLNKKLAIHTAPVSDSKVLTPAGFADRDLAWIDNDRLVVARSKEEAWNEDEGKRPMPKLMEQGIAGQNARTLSDPPPKWGDFFPYVNPDATKLTWIRTDRKRADVWIRELAEGPAKVFIKHIDMPASYYDRWDWSDVLSWYPAEHE